MSMSCYTYDIDDAASARWSGAVSQAIKGKRGQAMLRDLVMALDAMTDKRLYAGSFAIEGGDLCALGALAP